MDAQDYVVAIVFGAIIGVVARAVLPGRQSIGVIPTVLIGMGAAVAGTWAADRWELHSDWLFNVAGRGYDWAVVGVQVGIAVVGVAIAAIVMKAVDTGRDD